METYKQMKDRHQAEVNALPLGFAFSDKQFKEKLAAWNITEEEAKQGAVIAIGGGFIRSCDKDLVIDTFARIADEEQAAINADLTGDGYIYQMFRYELTNHEFSYTQDVTETLDALNISEEEIEANAALKHGLVKAIKEIRGE